MKKVDPTDLKPCSHMRGLVSAHVDGKLTGIAEWYTKWHISGCAQCQASIPFLQSLKGRLVELSVINDQPILTPDRLESVEANLANIDSDNLSV